MPDTSTRYLGLDLRNPIIVSSSSLTNSVRGVRQAADAGAGAVVLKSLFEEQIESDVDRQGREVDFGMHPEAEAYVRQMGMHLGPAEYLELVSESKKEIDIPVIASVNCVSTKWWGSYGKQIAESGADALELNIAIMPRSGGEDADDIQKRYAKIIDRVRQQVSLPLAVKIGPYFTDLPGFARSLRRAGASALVLFNRFYQFDIDPEKMTITGGYEFSSPNEINTSLRWVSILSGEVGCELSATTGVHDGAGAVKQLLAGATTVQVCSTVYQNGHGRIGEIVRYVEQWMERKGFGSIDEFRGKLNQAGSEQPEAYERVQYIKALTGKS